MFFCFCFFKGLQKQLNLWYNSSSRYSHRRPIKHKYAFLYNNSITGYEHQYIWAWWPDDSVECKFNIWVELVDMDIIIIII